MASGLIVAMRAVDIFAAVHRIINLADVRRAGGGAIRAMPVVVVVETTILRFGTRGSSARMSCVQRLTSPTLTACIQMTWRLVSACLRLAS